MSETARWYVVHTYSGYENKVASSIKKAVENRKLQDLINEVLVPTETVVEMKKVTKKDEYGNEVTRDEPRDVERKVFPGYVMIKMVMTDDSWYVVRNIRGVTGFVGPGSKPVPLTEEEVIRMGVERREIVVNFQVGDSVKVVDGSFEGFIGVVESIEPENNLVRVVVSMFGRDTPVEMELNHVETLF
jgi:transcriptional antiterminator NusG